MVVPFDIMFFTLIKVKRTVHIPNNIKFHLNCTLYRNDFVKKQNYGIIGEATFYLINDNLQVLDSIQNERVTALKKNIPICYQLKSCHGSHTQILIGMHFCYI